MAVIKDSPKTAQFKKLIHKIANKPGILLLFLTILLIICLALMIRNHNKLPTVQCLISRGISAIYEEISDIFYLDYHHVFRTCS